MASTGLGDGNVVTSKHGGVDHDFDAWKAQFWLQSVKHFHADAVCVTDTIGIKIICQSRTYLDYCVIFQ